MDQDLLELVDPLYAGPAGEFVAGRDALAKRLRAEGDRTTAAEVAKLRRPTATAHAMNQVARSEPALLAEALEARAALRAATEGAGRGEATELREATAADRAATRAVVAAARAVLGRDDPALAQRITDTLLAATVDPEVREVLVAGRLTAEQDASGLAFGSASDGGDGDVAPVVSLAERAEARRARGTTRKSAAPEPDAAAARAAAKAAAKEAEEAERARRRERAEREQAVGRLERRLARLGGKVEEAEAALAAAQEELAVAERELEEARAALAELEA